MCEQKEAFSYTVDRHRNWYKERYIFYAGIKGDELSSL